jgi:hypothetical protein
MGLINGATFRNPDSTRIIEKEINVLKPFGIK